MAHLIRPWQVRYVDKEGKRVPKGTKGARKVKERARKWYACNVPGFPPEKRIPLAGNKGVAQRLLADLMTKGERGQADLEDPVAEAQKATLEQHLGDFEASLKAKSRPPADQQRKLTLARVRDVFAHCGFQYPADLDAEAVAGYLAGRRSTPTEAGGISTQTSNYYLQAVGQFCRWMVLKERMARNPFQ